MMKNRFGLLLLMAMSLFAATPACGQAAGGAEEEREPFPVTLAGVGFSRSIFNLYLGDDDEYLPFSVSNSRINQPRRITTEGEVFFYEKVDVPGEEDPAFRPVAVAEVSPLYGEYLLFFEQDPSAGPGEPNYKVLVLPRPEESSRPGTVQFVNFSSSRIGCLFDGRDFYLDRGKEFTLVPDRGNDQLSVGLRVARQGEEGWEIGFNSVWAHRPGLRTLVLIVDDPNRLGSVKVRRLFDEIVRRSEGPSGIDAG